MSCKIKEPNGLSVMTALTTTTSRTARAVECVSALAFTPPGMPGTHTPIFWLGGRQREYPPNIITYFRT